MQIDSKMMKSFKLNDQFTLKNRIVMAPMTRVSASEDFVPTLEMADYYKRRAKAGLIITEGTIIREDALGYAKVPGIFTEEHIKGWQKVTDAVHEAGGIIFNQIWHVGRVTHPNFLNGNLPISSSETMMTGDVKRSGGLFYGKSRAASSEEIKQLILDYATAAKNAIKAGFDGVEIHGANGYLIDQFLHRDTNKRQDEYGGTPENFARFALEVVKAVGEAIGFERVGLRLSPGAYLNEIVGDMQDADTFKYLLQALNHFPLAYIHVGNFDDKNAFKELNDMTMTQFIRQYYQGTLIACGSYTTKDANEGLLKNEFDLIAIGRPFIANPDLIDRIERNEMLIPYDVSMLNTLY